jgi:tetratricopeptide (TPR) repeat protein
MELKNMLEEAIYLNKQNLLPEAFNKYRIISYISLNNMGTIKEKMGCLDEAVIYFENAIDIIPKTDKAYNNAFDTYMAMGRYEEAKELLTRFLKHSTPPTNKNIVYHHK